MEQPFLRPAGSYDELWSQVDFATMDIPERFNLGVACAERQDPDARALTVVDVDRTSRDHTFGEVTTSSNRLANALAALGIRVGDVVGLVSAASFETGVGFVAMWRMGAIALPLSSLFGPDSLRYRLRNAGAKAVVTASANAAKVREALDDGGAQVPLLVIGGEGAESYEAALAASSPEFTPVVTAAEDPAFLIYTSGTTGDPKGALHAHRIVFGHLPAFEAIYEFYPKTGDVLWSPADWAWIAGLMDILVPAWFHGLPVVVDREQSFTPDRVLWLLRAFDVTLTLLPPTALRVIRAAVPTGSSGGGFALRSILSGAEPVGAELLGWTQDYFDTIVNEGYGQTELNACIGNCASVYPIRPGSLGRGLPGTTAVVLGDDGEPVLDTVGELALDRRTPSTMLEYWRNPDATAAKFHGNWLLTGDLARQDAEGYIWFESRKDDVINSAGYRIGPGEIEQSLGGHDAVAMAAVIGVPDPRRGQVPKAFVVLRPGVTASAELADELRAHVRSRLAPHEVPRQIDFLDELPRTTTGKIMRRALRD